MGKQRHLPEIVAAAQVRQNFLFAIRQNRRLKPARYHHIKTAGFSALTVDRLVFFIFDKARQMADGFEFPLIEAREKRAQGKKDNFINTL